MRRCLIGIISIILAGLFFSPVATLAKGKPRLGVLRFTNNTQAGWWYQGVGSDLQDMLINELAGMKCFDVLERKELDAVLGEQNLSASGRISKSTRSKMGKILGAEYLVAATVSAYEEGTKGDGGGLSFKGISLGGKRGRAYVAVDLKVIEVNSGRIADSRTVEATSKSGGLSLGLHKFGLGGQYKKHAKTPAGKATRACVMEISEYLECSMIQGKNAGCMADYGAKEERRREKTKKSIELE